MMHRNGTLVARHPASEAAMGQHFPRFSALVAERQRWPGAHSLDEPGGRRRSFRRLRVGSRVPAGDRRDARFGRRAGAVACAGIRVCDPHARARSCSPCCCWRCCGASSCAWTRRARRSRSRASALRWPLPGRTSASGTGTSSATGSIASARAREIFGAGRAGQLSRDEWFATVQIHPDDAAQRREAIRAHLAGETPAYAGEYRVRTPAARTAGSACAACACATRRASRSAWRVR